MERITVKPSDIVILQLIVTTFFPESAIFTPLKIMFFSFSWVERIPFLWLANLEVSIVLNDAYNLLHLKPLDVKEKAC